MPSRTFISVCLNPAPNGTRGLSVRTLVGMLAHKEPLPSAAVEAAISLLTAHASQGLDEDILAKLTGDWCAQLEAPTRSEDFVLEVLEAWHNMRAVPAWPAEKFEETVQTVWRCAIAREAIDVAPESPPEQPSDIPTPARLHIEVAARQAAALDAECKFLRDNMVALGHNRLIQFEHFVEEGLRKEIAKRFAAKGWCIGFGKYGEARVTITPAPESHPI